MYAEYKNLPIRRVQGMYMEYGGRDCTWSMEMCKNVGGVQAYDDMYDTKSPQPYPFVIPVLFI